MDGMPMHGGMATMYPMMLLPFAVTLWRHRRTDRNGTLTWRRGSRLVIRCALTCAPLMTIAVVTGSTKIHAIAVVIATLRPLSLTFDRSCRMFLSNVIERAACIRTPTSSKERSICSS